MITDCENSKNSSSHVSDLLQQSVTPTATAAGIPNCIRYAPPTMTLYAPPEPRNLGFPQTNPFVPLEMDIQGLSINHQPPSPPSIVMAMDTSNSPILQMSTLGHKTTSGLMLTGSSSSGISSNDGGSPKPTKKSMFFTNQVTFKTQNDLQSPLQPSMASQQYHQPKCNMTHQNQHQSHNQHHHHHHANNLQMYHAAASQQFSTAPFKTKQHHHHHHHHHGTSDSSSGNEKDPRDSAMNTLEATENLDITGSNNNTTDKKGGEHQCQAPCHHKCKIGITCHRHGTKIASKAKRRAEKEARGKNKPERDPNRPPPIKSVVPPPVPKNQQNGYQTLKDLNFIDPVAVIPGSSKAQFFKRYKIFNVIGIGGGGTVYAGRKTENNSTIAIKRVLRSKVKRWEKTRDGRSVPQEIALMLRCNGHIGVVQLFDWYETVESFLLVLERPENSIDLFDYIRENGPLNEEMARHILTQVIAAIRHLHACGMVHRDIKDENVVLDRMTGVVKLIDFGCGTNLKDGPYTEFSGTAEFYPPEWFNQRRYWAGSATVWSLGVLLFDMLQGEIPFKNSDRIIENRPLFKEPVTNPARDLLRWMLANDYRKRPTFAQVLEHEWVKNCGNYQPITTF